MTAITMTKVWRGMKASELTPGERLVIARRRQYEDDEPGPDERRRNESQKEASERLGVSLYKYRAMELDEAEPVPVTKIGRLASHEACFVKRRRAGIELQDLADEMGIAAWWLSQIEYGRQPIDRLLEYWGES